MNEHILNLLLPPDTINVGSLVGFVQAVIEFREPQPEIGREQARAPDGWTPDVGANAVVGEISRRELAGAADATVAIFPSRGDGIPFLEKLGKDEVEQMKRRGKKLVVVDEEAADRYHDHCDRTDGQTPAGSVMP